jgi:hypothetical protein
LARKINVLQNSYGVLSDPDQEALTAMEADSRKLIAQIDEMVKPEVESATHREGRLRDEQHEASMRQAPAPVPQPAPAKVKEPAHAGKR